MNLFFGAFLLDDDLIEDAALHSCTTMNENGVQ